MQISSRQREGVTIFELVGRLTLNEGAKELYTEVRTGLDSGADAFLLDLGRTTLIDSTGLGVLISCLTSAQTRGGAVKLLRPSPKVEDVLRITATWSLFEVHDDETAGVQSFQEGSTDHQEDDGRR